MQRFACRLAHLAMSGPDRHRQQHDVGGRKACDAHRDEEGAFFARLVGCAGIGCLRRNTITEIGYRLGNPVSGKRAGPPHPHLSARKVQPCLRHTRQGRDGFFNLAEAATALRPPHNEINRALVSDNPNKARISPFGISRGCRCKTRGASGYGGNRCRHGRITIRLFARNTTSSASASKTWNRASHLPAGKSATLVT